MTFLLVAAGGFFGASARYYLSKKLKLTMNSFPVPTLFINLIGSFLLGVIIGASTPSAISSFFGIGFLGSFTTYSTFMVENVQLMIEGKWKSMLTYSCLSYLAGIFFAFIGFLIGT
ncbi:fluoride efflux transporter FluC [Lederbergia citrea]|uniref:fluoride efflux transporter FluC n=1 Tax=Lederbergia citrea TaxID=2833581 RepID=UPI001BC8FB7F|nr:CrcB family protein [Lederbergia citrea]MBS4203505.1 CrcB family protein [Lederbergia citrea]